MVHIRVKRIHGRPYVYVVRSYRDAAGNIRKQYVRYVGPTDPVYGGRGPVDVQAEREKLKRRKVAL